MKKFIKKISKKNSYIIFGVAVAIIFIIVLIAVISKKQDIINIFNQPSVPVTSTTQKAQNQNTQVKPSAGTTTTPSSFLTYQEVLKAYTGKRFQFVNNREGNCIMSPTSATFKNNTKVMLDNRTDKSMTVYLNGVANVMPAYGYKVVTLTATGQLPFTIKVDCNAGKNNGQIILQK
jgi:hypothetical protein